MLLVVVASCLGCGNETERLEQVTGKVMFEGKPLVDHLVVLQDETRGIHMTAKLDARGEFQVSTARGDGIARRQLCRGDYTAHR